MHDPEGQTTPEKQIGVPQKALSYSRHPPDFDLGEALGPSSGTLS